MSNTPVRKFVAGGVTVSVWENEALGKDGIVNTYPSVSLDKRYKDKSGEWKSSKSMKTTDLPKAILVLQKAYEFLALKDQESPALVVESALV
jgi:hypothetical protein